MWQHYSSFKHPVENHTILVPSFIVCNFLCYKPIWALYRMIIYSNAGTPTNTDSFECCLVQICFGLAEAEQTAAAYQLWEVSSPLGRLSKLLAWQFTPQLPYQRHQCYGNIHLVTLALKKSLAHWWNMQKNMKGGAGEGGWHDSPSPEAHLLEMCTPEQSAKQVSQAI